MGNICCKDNKLQQDQITRRNIQGISYSNAVTNISRIFDIEDGKNQNQQIFNLHLDSGIIQIESNTIIIKNQIQKSTRTSIFQSVVNQITELQIIEQSEMNIPDLKKQSKSQVIRNMFKSILNPQFYLPEIVNLHLKNEIIIFKYIFINRFYQEYIEIYMLKYILKFNIYLMKQQFLNNNKKDLNLIEITESYICKKLSYQFQLHRFSHSLPNINLFIKDFLIQYFDQNKSNLQFKNYLDKEFKLCNVKFENNSIVYSQYFVMQQELFFNTYLFLNEIEFNRVIQVSQKVQNIELLKSLFCNLIYSDFERHLIFEEKFDLSLEQILTNGFVCSNFNFIDYSMLLLQLIDVALIFDEYGVFYNQYDIEHIGIIYKEGKSIIKLRKMFLLKQYNYQYVIKSTSLKRYLNKFERKHILYYEICSILDLISLFESKLGSQSEQYKDIKSSIIENEEYQNNGINQKQLIEHLERYFNKDEVLSHFPSLNNQYLELMINDYHKIYSQQMREKSQQDDLIELYQIGYKELVDNSQYKKMCYINNIIIWLINQNNNDIKQYLKQISSEIEQVDEIILIHSFSYVLKHFLVCEIKQNTIEMILNCMIQQMITINKIGLLGFMIDCLTFMHLKDGRLNDLGEILNKISKSSNVKKNNKNQEIKKQIFLTRFFIKLFEKQNIQNLKSEYLKYIKFFLKMDDIHQSEDAFKENYIKTINHLIPSYRMEVLINLIFQDYKLCNEIIDKECKIKKQQTNIISYFQSPQFEPNILIIFVSQILSFKNYNTIFGFRLNESYTQFYHSLGQSQFRKEQNLLLQLNLIDQLRKNSKNILIFLQLLDEMDLQDHGYQIELFQDYYDITEKVSDQILKKEDLLKQLNELEQQKQLSNTEIPENLQNEFEYIIREYSIPTEEQKLKFETARKNLSKLLLIDINSLILHENGMTTEYQSLLPDEKEGRIQIDISNTDRNLLRKSTDCYYNKEIYQEEIQYFVQKIQQLINITVNRQLEKDDELFNFIYIFLNLNQQTSMKQVEQKQLESIKSMICFCYLNQLNQQYHNLQIKLQLIQSNNQHYNLYQAYDLKYQNSYQIINIMNSEYFYKQLDYVLSINQSSVLELYLAQVAFIDYDFQSIYTLSGQYQINDLKVIYKKNNENIPEETIKKLLAQIFKIIMLFFDNKHYLMNFDLSQFGLYKSNSNNNNNNQNNFFIKYQNILEITNNLSKALTQLSLNDNKFSEKYNQQSLFTEELYLQVFTQQICLNMLSLINNCTNNAENECSKELKIEDQVSLEYALKNIQSIYSDELVGFLSFYLNLDKQQVFYTQEEILYKISELSSQRNTPEHKQMINLSIIDQKQIIDDRLGFEFSEGFQELNMKNPQFKFFLPQEILTKVLQQTSENINKSEKMNQNLDDYTKVLYNSYYIKNDIEVIINQIVTNNIYFKDLQTLQQIVTIQQYITKNYESNLKNQEHTNIIEKRMIIQTQKYFLKQGQIHTYVENRKKQYKDKFELQRLQRTSLSVFQQLFTQDLYQINESLDTFAMEEEKMYKELLCQVKRKDDTFLQHHFKDITESLLIKLQYPKLAEYRYFKDYNKIDQINNRKYFQDRQQSTIVEDNLLQFNFTIQQIRRNNYEYLLSINNIQNTGSYYGEKITMMSQLIMSQKIKCMCMMMLNQNAEQDLKMLEKLFCNNVLLQEKDNIFLKRPQKEVEELSNNISQFYLIKNPNLIEYYSQLDLLDLNIHSKNEQCSFDQLLSQIQEIKQNEESPLKNYQSKEVSQMDELLLSPLIKPERSQHYLSQNYNSQEQEKVILVEDIFIQEQQNDFGSENQFEQLSQVFQSSNLKAFSSRDSSNKKEYMSLNMLDQDEINDDNYQFSQNILVDSLNFVYNKTSELFSNYQFGNEVSEFPNFINNNLKINLMPSISNSKQSQSQSIFERIESVNYQLYDQKFVENENNTYIFKYDNLYTEPEEQNQNVQIQQNLVEFLTQQKYISFYHDVDSINNYDDIQKNNDKLKYYDNLFNIEILDQGDWGQVKLQFDIVSKQRYILKSHYDQQEYLKEKNAFLKQLNNEQNHYISRYICNLVQYSDTQQSLLFNIGISNLCEANQILKQTKTVNLKQNLKMILQEMIKFNLVMQQLNLYHGDIKPENIMIYENEKQQSIHHILGIEQENLDLIQIKFIDFKNCSNDPSRYYSYKSPNYKYMKYFINQTHMDWKRVLFAEMYSSCKVIYSLLNEDDKFQVQNIQFEIKILSDMNCQNQIESDQKLLYFLSIFLGNSDFSLQLQNEGISINLLIYLASFFEQNSQIQTLFNHSQIDSFKRDSWRKLSEIQSQQASSEIELQIINAFSFRNKLKEEFSKIHQHSKELNNQFKIALDQLQIIAIYDQFTNDELQLIENKIYSQFFDINEDSFFYLLQLCCFFYQYGSEGNYLSILKLITKNKVNLSKIQEEQPIIKLVMILFSENNLSQSEIINLLDALQNQSVDKKHISFFYEFILTKLIELDDFSDDQNTLNLSRIIEELIQSEDLNIFQKKNFSHMNLFLYNFSKSHSDEFYCNKFSEYRKLCKNLKAIPQNDCIMYYNYHLTKLNSSSLCFIDLQKVEQNMQQTCKVQQYLNKKQQSLKQNIKYKHQKQLFKLVWNIDNKQEINK